MTNHHQRGRDWAYVTQVLHAPLSEVNSTVDGEV